MAEVFLGLGSNLGDRRAWLAQALERLKSVPGIAGIVCSNVFESAAVGGVVQGDFLNLVVRAETTLAPRELLHAALGIEASLGRVRRERWGPRNIDIDVLCYGDLESDDPSLLLPHPRMTERGFVVFPMLELAANKRVYGKPVAWWAQQLEAASVVNTGPLAPAPYDGTMRWKEIPKGDGILGLFERLSRREGCVFLDSALEAGGLGRYSILGYEPRVRIVGRKAGCDVVVSGTLHRLGETGWNVLAKLWRDRVREGARPFPVAPGVIGFFSYESGLGFEGLRPSAADDLGVPTLQFGFYDRLVVEDCQEGRLYLVAEGDTSEDSEALLDSLDREVACLRESSATPSVRGKATCGPITSNFTRDGYDAAVGRIRDYIAAGDVYQVNLAQRFEASLDGLESDDLYRRLRRLSPAPYSAYLRLEGVHVVSSSPERFLQVRGRQVTTRPIKGTRPRGADSTGDEANRRELSTSAKDRAELLMIVDLERNDLGRVCVPGSVVVGDLYQLEEYPTVFHLVASVSGELRPGVDLFDVLKATFPGGSITGAPKVRAMQIIDELEPHRRHVYTGAIGRLGFDGSADLSIAIRTIQCANGRAWFHAGSGIVWDSNPKSEYDETLAKARALMEALKGTATGGDT